MKYTDTDFTGWDRQLQELEMDATQKAYGMAEVVATSVVNHARSLTSETKPGVKEGEGARRVHPGGWADITSNLANSIGSNISWNGFTLVTTIEAGMEYAAYLDALEGIDVLGGADKIITNVVRQFGEAI